jgi:hypothetical protein
MRPTGGVISAFRVEPWGRGRIRARAKRRLCQRIPLMWRRTDQCPRLRESRTDLLASPDGGSLGVCERAQRIQISWPTPRSSATAARSFWRTALGLNNVAVIALAPRPARRTLRVGEDAVTQCEIERRSRMIFGRMLMISRTPGYAPRAARRPSCRRSLDAKFGSPITREDLRNHRSVIVPNSPSRLGAGERRTVIARAPA